MERLRSTAMALAILMASSFVASLAWETFFEPFNVTYDHRSLILGGKRRMLISAGIHYPRATPDMWPGLIKKSKEGGADVIETYVFWNGHEPTKGRYNFEGRYDLVKFAKLIGSSGLYFFLRIGPYACAEWNFGGFPVWLRDIPGIEFRTNNEPYKAEMRRFVTKIVDLMHEEMLFSWQGGPIILLQIENEYGNIESLYGEGGKQYLKWAADLAIELGAGVPWVMCRQPDAPEYIIDSCNEFYCDGFKPNSNQKPVIWTEDWNGWYANWGESLPHRPVEDNAFAIARFFARGGCFHNYYMFFGGTNFGRTAGGPLQITSYDYDAPIDAYGFLRQPKWGHLKGLHAALKLCELALISVTGSPQYEKLGLQQEVHIYSDIEIDVTSRLPDNISICSAFLANLDTHSSKTVKFLGQSYNLPPWSVSILPDCRHIVFNTAKISHQSSIMTTESTSSGLSEATNPGLIKLHHKDSYILKSWMFYKEPLGSWNNSNFVAQGILEHLNVTKDVSDYLWYITRINVTTALITSSNGRSNIPKLTIGSIRDVVRIFLNGKLAGSKAGHWVPVDIPIQLVQGDNELAIITETVGLQNYGAFLERDGAGIKGQAKLLGVDAGEIDLSKSAWAYKIGLEGEHKQIYSLQGHEAAEWSDLVPDSLPSGFTWYKAFFDAPTGGDPVAIDMGSMRKGQVWVNGHGIGRYWSLMAPKNGCPKFCDYRGTYSEGKCRSNCGQLTQRWYHVPRSWLQASNNLLVIFEEEGGDPFKISLKLHSTHTICVNISENHAPPPRIWSHPDFLDGRISISDVAPEVQLHCDAGQVISAVTFSSFGNPHGSCRQFSTGTCHSSNSLQVVSEACVGKNGCHIAVSAKTFGGDPCPGTIKTLAVEAKCSSDAASA